MKKILVLTIAAILVVSVSISVYFLAFRPEYDLLSPPTYYLNGFPVNDFAYQLQELDINEISSSSYDLIIIDYSSDGTKEGEFTSSNLNQMKQEEKLLLSYMSIGEAETYRFYWNNSWDSDNNGIPDVDSPAWLDIENPEWEGNYKVKYWYEAWQKVIFGSTDSYLDRIIDVGFDGCYLDIIDAFEYYEDTYSFAKAEMIDFVVNLSTYAKAINEDFLVFPQNGEILLENSTYRNAIDGIGREDVFFNDNRKNDEGEILQIIELLNLLKNEDKTILIIDYPTRKPVIYQAYSQAYDNGYLAYVGPRDLDELITYDFSLPD